LPRFYRIKSYLPFTFVIFVNILINEWNYSHLKTKCKQRYLCLCSSWKQMMVIWRVFIMVLLWCLFHAHYIDPNNVGVTGDQTSVHFHAVKTYTGSWGTVPLILNIGTGWMWVFNFYLQHLYSGGKNTQYPLNRRLGGPRAGLDISEERKNLTPAGDRTLDRPVCRLITIPTELSWLIK
jgi:hypothetical protein